MTSTVGIREAKTNLSRILRRVRHGAEVVITDRGKPVGRIVPLREDVLDLQALVGDLEARGVLAEKRGKGRLHPPLLLQGGLAQKFLKEDRG